MSFVTPEIERKNKRNKEKLERVIRTLCDKK
jgi:hypothetical protein